MWIWIQLNGYTARLSPGGWTSDKIVLSAVESLNHPSSRCFVIPGGNGDLRMSSGRLIYNCAFCKETFVHPFAD